MPTSYSLGEAFEHGQSYVALSRVRGLEGLLLRAFDKKKLTAHPKVLKYYKQLDPSFDASSTDGDDELRKFIETTTKKPVRKCAASNYNSNNYSIVSNKRNSSAKLKPLWLNAKDSRESLTFDVPTNSSATNSHSERVGKGWKRNRKRRKIMGRDVGGT